MRKNFFKYAMLLMTCCILIFSAGQAAAADPIISSITPLSIFEGNAPTEGMRIFGLNLSDIKKVRFLDGNTFTLKTSFQPDFVDNTEIRLTQSKLNTLAVGDYYLEVQNSQGGNYGYADSYFNVVVAEGQRKLIIKKITSDGDGLFTYNISGPENKNITIQSNGGGGVEAQIPLFPGEYTIAEQMPDSGWSLAYAFCEGQNNPQAGNSISRVMINPGEDTVCEFSNIFKNTPPTLKVVKILNPVTDPGRFNLLVNNQIKAVDQGNNGSTGLIPLPVGTYTASETAGAGTALENYTRTFSGDCNATGSVTLKNADKKTCYITNQKINPTRATITLTKTTNSNSGQFTFSLTNGPTNPGNITLNPAVANNFVDTFVINDILPGTYNLNETSSIPADFNLNTASCTGNNGLGVKGMKAGSSITGINLAAGDSIVCTFNNTKNGGGGLTPVILGITPSSATALQPVTLTINGNNFAQGITIRLNGQYLTTNFSSSTRVTTNIPAGLLPPGTSNQIIASISGGPSSEPYNFIGNFPVPNVQGVSPITGYVVNQPQDLFITGTDNTFFQGDSVILLDGVQQPTTFISPIRLSAKINSSTPGQKRVRVRNPKPGGGDSPEYTITVSSDSGTNKGTLIINKVTNGGDGTFAFSAVAVPRAPVNASVTAIGGKGTATVSLDPASNYSLSETLPTGWALTSSSCSSGSPSSFSISAGQTITCTFTNTKGSSNAAPKLTVNKILSPASDSGRFNLFVGGIQRASNVGNGGSTGQLTLTAGTYVISETAVAPTNLNDYTVTYGGDCSSGGSIQLSNGDTKTCTITNTYNPPEVLYGWLKIVKSVTGDNRTLSFSFNVNSQSGTTIVSTRGGTPNSGESGQITVPVGTANTITETIPNGWNLSSVSCDKSFTATGAGATNITVLAGETTTCTFTNSQGGNNNPGPTITSLNPPEKNACGTADTLTITGTGFIPSSVLYFGGLAVSSSYISATKLTTNISQTPEGQHVISVVNSAPGGGKSNEKIFTVNAESQSASPVIVSIDPPTVQEGSSAFTLTINGENFAPDSILKFSTDGGKTYYARTFTYVSGQKLTKNMTAVDVESPRTYRIMVTNPASADQCSEKNSNSRTLTVTPENPDPPPPDGEGEETEDEFPIFIEPAEPPNN